MPSSPLVLPLALAVALASSPDLAPQVSPPEAVRFLSFNIRYGTAKDGPNHWSKRRDAVVAAIGRLDPHVLGVQEALAFQIDYLTERFPHLERVGQGRLGDRRGEHCSLFVDRRRFEIARHGDFWLSETPQIVASKSWDSSLPRLATWAVLRDRTCDARVAVLNTHFDHRGERARAASARMIAARLRTFSGLPVVAMGDLNAGEGSEPVTVLTRSGLRDTYRVLHPEIKRVGTFHGWLGETDGEKIDYVLCDDGWEVAKAYIDRGTTGDGRLPSDHFAVGASLVPKSGAAPRLMPVLDGPFWHISGPADLGPLGTERQQTVDHAIFRAADGTWQLWACVRGTRVGRVLYGWEGDYLEQKYWRSRGVVMRADPTVGESIDDWGGEEWIQAPFVVWHRGVYHMLYGAHRSELGDCQISLAASQDGRDFNRHRNERGLSRVFVGPGEARDPMVVQIGTAFHCYYTGHDEGQRAPCKIYCRTSNDLVHWSDAVAVNWGGTAGDGNWSAECPFVVERDGWFYLFRTNSYTAPSTHVYRSQDPLDFGRGNDSKKIGTIPVAAPEIVGDGAQTYVSSVHDLKGGVQLARLQWLDELEAPTSLAGRARMRELWSFEDGTLGEWDVEGAAFANQPTFARDATVRGQRFGHDGHWFVGTYENRPKPDAAIDGTQGDEPTGSMRSPPFVLPEGWVTFRIGGGRDRERLYVALVLVDGDQELARATGGETNQMRTVNWKMTQHAGKAAYFRVVDASSEQWGHLDVDDFRVSRGR